MEPFTLACHHANPHGIVAAVHIPDSADPVPASVLQALVPEEQELASTLRGYSQVQFVGGRLALHAAARQLDAHCGPVLRTARGAPALQSGLVGSVSHKRTLALALVARQNEATLGVDLEDYGPERPAIASRVLTPAELVAVRSLPAERQWMAVLVRFSLKEALYKALDPHVQRYVGFQEAEIEPDLLGGAAIALHLANGEGPFVAEAHYEWFHGRLLTSVRLRREPATPPPS